MKDDAAACSGTHHVEMLDMAFRNHDALERIAEPVGVMFTGPAPDNRRRAFLDESLLGGKNVGRLFVRPRHLNRNPLASYTLR